MLFTDLYGQYINPHRTAPVNPVFCQQTKQNILYDLRTIEERNKEVELRHYSDFKAWNTQYYKLFLDSLGDVDKPDYPGVCYEVYNKIYSKNWEKNVRRKQIENEKSNGMLCKWFNIPDRYAGHTFQRTKPNTDQEQLFNTSKNYVKSKFKESLWLGSEARGVGKTTNAVCVAMEYYVLHDFNKIKAFRAPYEILNNSILFIKEYDLIKLVPNKHDFNPVYYRSALLNRLAEIDLLVYDDCYKYGDAEYIKEFLHPLMDSRLENNAKPTVITSTFKESTLPKAYPDLYSRLQRGTIYYTRCQTDYRKK